MTRKELKQRLQGLAQEYFCRTKFLYTRRPNNDHKKLTFLSLWTCMLPSESWSERT